MPNSGNNKLYGGAMLIATLKITLEEGIMDPVFFSTQEDMPTSWGSWIRYFLTFLKQRSQ